MNEWKLYTIKMINLKSVKSNVDNLASLPCSALWSYAELRLGKFRHLSNLYYVRISL